MRIAESKDAEAIARVHIACWQTTYQGIFPDQYLVSFSQERRENSWTKILTSQASDEFVYVVEMDGAGIVGFASAGPIREDDPIYEAEIYAIYILEEHQQNGIGRRLVKQLCQRFAEDGKKSLLVWTLEGGSSTAFYEALQGVVVKQRTSERGGVVFNEIAFGWQNIDTINRPIK